MIPPHLSEQEQIRRQSLDDIRKLGIDPYPAAMYPVNVSAAQIIAGFRDEENNYPEVCLAGRIMSRRIMGNASFLTHGLLRTHTVLRPA